MDLKGRNFLTLKDFTPEEILYFIDRAEELKKQFGVTLDKRKIVMADIKAFGGYTAELKLPQGVTGKLSVLVTE